MTSPLDVAASVLAPLERWHRLEVRGIERLPDGPALLVANHSGGGALVDGLWLLRRHRELGGAPVVILAHDALFRVPGVGAALRALGAVPASPVAARAALAAGRKVLVFPGTDHDALRPFSARREVRLAGHRGFARLAVDAGVPVVPIVGCGGHEGFVVLTQGRRVAQALGMPRWSRWHSFPVVLCLPWGVAVGPLAYLPYLPLPTKVVVEVGEPILAPAGEDAAERLYAEVEAALQARHAALYAERRWPVIG